MTNLCRNTPRQAFIEIISFLQEAAAISKQFAISLLWIQTTRLSVCVCPCPTYGENPAVNDINWSLCWQEPDIPLAECSKYVTQEVRS